MNEGLFRLAFQVVQVELSILQEELFTKLLRARRGKKTYYSESSMRRSGTTTTIALFVATLAAISSEIPLVVFSNNKRQSGCMSNLVFEMLSKLRVNILWKSEDAITLLSVDGKPCTIAFHSNTRNDLYEDGTMVIYDQSYFGPVPKKRSYFRRLVSLVTKSHHPRIKLFDCRAI
jgi:hypothetical protein